MPTSRWARIAGWSGLALHVPVLLWYLATTLVAPVWAVAGLVVVWTGLLFAGVRLMRDRPLLVSALPLVDALVWFATVSAGEAFLGWTA